MQLLIAGLFLLISLADVWCVDEISLQKNDTSLRIIFNPSSSLFDLTLSYGDAAVLNATLGHGLGLTEDKITNCDGLSNCYLFGDDIRMHVHSNIDNGFTIFWRTKNTSVEFMDCVDLNTEAQTHWYGGPERNYQHYPIEKLVIDGVDYAVHEQNFSAISEPYWVNSRGAYLFVDERVPLFVDQNNAFQGRACFIAKQQDPYHNRPKIVLNYTLAAQENVREAHIHAVQHFLGKPTGHPNNKMISRPIWSTWARYKKNINDATLLEFANEIVNNGFRDGQFEIDDYWETCYGSLTFGDTFPNINSTVQTIKAMDFRVTLWVHPFINVNCSFIERGMNNDFIAKAADGTVTTTWWNSEDGYDAVYIDFTNPEAREWFADRLNLIKQLHDIDAFKFDAGESSFATDMPVLSGDPELAPNSLVSDYVKTCATFGDLIEVRTGYRTQYLPVFVRMIDKDSYWGENNGLYTLITTLIAMNLNGYVLVLPDMVGGNGYENAGGTPGGELFVRWLQANTFMPAIQFSYVPWDYETLTDSTGTTYNVVEVSQKFVALHDQYSNYIIQTMETSIEKGYPVNAPLWWVDPTDPDSLKEDTEYMLGEDILVAPVIVEGAVSRDVYLPQGTWIDGNSGTEYEGRQTIRNYSAPLDTLPYFIRKDVVVTEPTSASFTINSSNFLSFGIGFVITILIFVSS
ncbi:myogenesis-regulating glycosidase-like [Agrilus planipennis]|uniref:Myogenesis-regulating glycosidase-like n=1 Tax=Agrilus planipennis TaxID=224129 RepID=A0A1W4WM59_AGRPL|nr:myogenesis-regulating glycosidase-like [Agrilus planipennis]